MKKFQKFVPITLVVVGAILLLLSNYIARQVAEGREKIESAQQQVNTGKGLFSESPAAKEAGDFFQGRLDSASDEANSYAVIAHRLQFGGIALIVVGVGIFFIRRRK